MERIKYFLRNLIVPAAAHLAVLGVFSIVDPCNNNSGCMAGSPTAIFLRLGTLPALVVLLVFTIFQAGMIRPNYFKYLKINMVVAMAPFFLAGVAYIAFKSFT